MARGERWHVGNGKCRNLLHLHLFRHPVWFCGADLLLLFSQLNAIHILLFGIWQFGHFLLALSADDGTGRENQVGCGRGAAKEKRRSITWNSNRQFDACQNTRTDQRGQQRQHQWLLIGMRMNARIGQVAEPQSNCPTSQCPACGFRSFSII